MVQSLWKTVGQFLTKLNIHLLWHQEVLLLGLNLLVSREIKTHIHRKTCVYSGYIHNSQETGNKKKSPSAGKWISKTVAHAHNEILLSNVNEPGYWCAQKHRWVTKALCKQEKPDSKATCSTIPFIWCFEPGKRQYYFLVDQWGEEFIQREGIGGNFGGDKPVNYCSNDHTIVFICQNSLYT